MNAPPRLPLHQVSSPCVSLCRIDPASGLCEGCLRTIDEITAWGTMSDDARRRVWAALDARRAVRDRQLDSTAPARTPERSG